MSRSKVAIIGRPNVGKSSLFNYLIGERRSVVKDEPGVTRDLLYGEVELWGKVFDVVDTGGLTDKEDTFSPLIRDRVKNFISTADLILFVVDGRAGLVPEDRDVLRIAQEAGKPFLLVVNKVDSIQDFESSQMDFYELGVEHMIPVSVERRYGMPELLEWLHERVASESVDDTRPYRLALVGKPNVGKSSLLNRLSESDRAMVSDVAGTTIDPVDIEIEHENEKYMLIDTAGLRRSARRETGLEILSAIKSHKVLERVDMVLLLVDAATGPTDQDAKIAEAAYEEFKPVILVANKVDIAEETTPAMRSHFHEMIKETFHFFPDIPVAFISAKTGKGIKGLFELIQETRGKLEIDIPTSELNDFFMKVIRLAPAPVAGTKSVKFYYLTQTQQTPPSFIAFANFPEAVDNAYRRFLIKKIKEQWDLWGIPIRIFAMKKGGRWSGVKGC